MSTESTKLKNNEGKIEYFYSSTDISILYNYVFVHLWNFIAKLIPKSVHPNCITIFGFSSIITLCLMDSIYTGFTFKMSKSDDDTWIEEHGDYSFGENRVKYMYLLFAFLSLCAWMADGVDGKFARNTNQTSPIGEYLDHCFDSLRFTLNWISMFFLLGHIFVYLMNNVDENNMVVFDTSNLNSSTKITQSLSGFKQCDIFDTLPNTIYIKNYQSSILIVSIYIHVLVNNVVGAFTGRLYTGNFAQSPNADLAELMFVAMWIMIALISPNTLYKKVLGINAFYAKALLIIFASAILDYFQFIYIMYTSKTPWYRFLDSFLLSAIFLVWSLLQNYLILNPEIYRIFFLIYAFKASELMVLIIFNGIVRSNKMFAKIRDKFQAQVFYDILFFMILVSVTTVYCNYMAVACGKVVFLVKIELSVWLVMLVGKSVYDFRKFAYIIFEETNSGWFTRI